ncbi:amidase [Leptolyngbya ohadii]|uniref:amidase n=1 Tax=Leptolyngbya ohadii TaxID=1962290 RepID=UPI000B5A0ED0|nr:amidase [Leptolyngbya ohadii]
MELHQLSASELAQKIRDREIRAIDAVNACLQQIKRWDSQIRAFITLCEDSARQAALEADRLLEAGHLLGALHGVPIAIKDLTATAGIRTTYGSSIYQDHVPTKDELAVARLKAAGAIILGKTNTPEFGMGAQTSNAILPHTATPYALDRSSGGSSGGSAAAVASGMAYLAQGTDMGGSVRTPASFCSIVGLRPAIGRIPRPGKPLLWETLSTDGVLARSVEDAALMLSVMSGEDQRDPIALTTPWQMPLFTPDVCNRLRGQMRVGYSADLGIAIIDNEVKTVFEAAIAQMSSLCRRLQSAHPDCTQAPFAFETLRAATIAHLHQHHYDRHREQLSETVRWNIEHGFNLTAAALLQAETARSRLYRQFMLFFQQYDVLAIPTACVPPFPHSQPEVLEVNGIPLPHIIDYLKITYTITLTGLPALSIPCGWTASGLPIGLQLVGKPQGETELLQFAYLLQEQLDFRHRWASL